MEVEHPGRCWALKMVGGRCRGRGHDVDCPPLFVGDVHGLVVLCNDHSRIADWRRVPWFNGWGASKPPYMRTTTRSLWDEYEQKLSG